MFSNDPSIIDNESCEGSNKGVLNHWYGEYMRNPNEKNEADR
jgi:hypothetical protein